MFNDNLITKPLTEEEYDHHDVGIDLEQERAQEVADLAAEQAATDLPPPVEVPEVAPPTTEVPEVPSMAMNIAENSLNITETERQRAADESALGE